MRIGHYYPDALHISTGVTKAISAWCSAQAEEGNEVVLLHGGPSKRSVPAPPNIELRFVRHSGKHRQTAIPLRFKSHIADLDMLVLHEGWTIANVGASDQARRANIPYVIMPHGVYEPETARTLRPPMSVRRIVEARTLRRAHGVHLFFESEAEPVARLTPHARCFVAPTGHDLPSETWRGGGGYLLWVGRYAVHHKGLDLLLSAMAELTPSDRPRIIMRGVDYRGGKAVLQAMIAGLDLHASVELGAEVHGKEKLQLLLNADGYLHPARYDCLPGALVEALALDVPSLATSSMHIAELLKRAAAAVVCEPTPESLAAGLLSLAAGRPDLSGQGRQFVSDHFQWKASLDSWRQAVQGATIKPE